MSKHIDSTEFVKYAQGDLQFANWLIKVNERVEYAIDMTIFDVADFDFRTLYDNNADPATAAIEFLDHLENWG